MGRISHLLSYQGLLSRIKTAPSDKDISISCGGGLYLRIFGKERRKYWYARAGAKRRMERLGEFPAMPMSEARLKSGGAIKEIEEKETPKATGPLFGALANEWLATKTHLARYANIRKSVEYLKPLFELPVAAVGNLKAKEAILSQQITPWKTREVISTLSSIMDLAVENEYIKAHSLNVLRKSPAFARPQKGEGIKFVELDKFPDLFKKLSALPLQLREYCLLLCLTCLRPGECRQMRFIWLNKGTETIDVPGALMKVKKPYPFRVPLTRQIAALWVRISTGAKGECLFPMKTRDEPMRENAFSEPFKLVTGGMAMPHGFRKSARSWLASQGCPVEVAAMCLDHELDLGADRVYQRSDLLELRRPWLQRYHDAVEQTLPQAFRKLLA